VSAPKISKNFWDRAVQMERTSATPSKLSISILATFPSRLIELAIDDKIVRLVPSGVFSAAAIITPVSCASKPAGRGPQLAQIPERFGLDPIRDIQVLCPMNRGGLGARSLNIELQNALNPPGEVRIDRFGWTFCPGDKVMQVENDYDKEVYNGDLGVVSRIDMEESELTVDFDGRGVIYGFAELDELVLAYATTIHKSQGSEYPAVVIPLTTQHYVMLQRNLVVKIKRKDPGPNGRNLRPTVNPGGLY
jgi:ATP-dependent RecD-like DNA helicase SH3 domain/UvrD-like helicase C-terminal domain